MPLFVFFSRSANADPPFPPSAKKDLSNFSHFDVEYNGHLYSTVEHAFQALKYTCTDQPDLVNIIREKYKNEPGNIAKKSGSKTEMTKYKVSLNIECWNQQRDAIMRKLIESKIKRHPEIQHILRLIQQGNYTLVHHADRGADLYWGAVKDKDNDSIKGENKLGTIYMSMLDSLESEECKPGEKCMKVQKLDFITITKSSTLNTYYEYKQYYDSRKQKPKMKCPKCKLTKLKDLTFTIKKRELISTCPNPKCTGNMRIKLGEYITFENYYADHKNQYNDSISNILAEKFNVLFGYKKEGDILNLKTDYIEQTHTMTELIQDYLKIVDTHPEELEVLNAQKEELIQAIHNGEKPYSELNLVLCKIRKLKYSSIEMYDWKEIKNAPYTIKQLEICTLPD